VVGISLPVLLVILFWLATVIPRHRDSEDDSTRPTVRPGLFC
jgi:hypothetical protein